MNPNHEKIHRILRILPNCTPPNHNCASAWWNTRTQNSWSWAYFGLSPSLTWDRQGECGHCCECGDLLTEIIEQALQVVLHWYLHFSLFREVDPHSQIVAPVPSRDMHLSIKRFKIQDEGRYHVPVYVWYLQAVDVPYDCHCFSLTILFVTQGS